MTTDHPIRTVLITGGSSGIGAALVRAFAGSNHSALENSGPLYQVWFTFRSGEQRAKALLEEINNSSHNGDSGEVGKQRGVIQHRAFHFDQGSWDSQQLLLQGLPGPVDILIHNAALGSATVKHYAQEEHLRDQALLQVNALGVLWLTEAIVPGMVERGYGRVVVISSVGGGITQFPAFRLADGMSKAAVTFMARQLAAQHTHTPVGVFCVCPGATDTDMFQASTLQNMTEEERTNFEARLPKKRLIVPQEIASVVLFLCKPEADCLHGAVIDASLGLGVHPGLMTGKEERENH